jgi:hypothetical protein
MMTTRLRTSLLIVAALTLTASVSAQEGHPLAGTWYGDYTAGGQKHDLTVIMKWDGAAITGQVNPGPNVKKLTATMGITPGKPNEKESTEGIPPIFHVKFEFDGMTFEGDIQNPVAGNRRISGKWTRGSETGTFQIRRL